MLYVAGILLGICLAYFIISYWLTNRTIHSTLPTLTYDERHFNKTLAKLLIPRWPGSLGHEAIAVYLLKELDELGFLALRDEIPEAIQLTNIIGVFNPNAKRFLLLSCHYDSKNLGGGDSYIAATDGGVPCALLLNIAKNLNSFLHNVIAKQKEIGLLLVFFDGHDIDGKEDDSITRYGSQHFVNSEIIQLNRIKLVLTFKLIGAPFLIFMSKYESTYHLHERLADIEQELAQSGSLKKCNQLFYKLSDHGDDFEDDHYSFLNKGIPVMHIMPHNYPLVWHTPEDNIEYLHWPTIRNIIMISTQFIHEYLNTSVSTVDNPENSIYYSIH